MVPDQIWDLLKTGGIAGFAILVWWLERRERSEVVKESQVRLDAQAMRIEKIAMDATSAIQRVYDLLSSAKK